MGASKMSWLRAASMAGFVALANLPTAAVQAAEAPGSRVGAIDKTHAIIVEHAVTTTADLSKVQRFFANLADHYLAISPDHREFKVRGGGPLHEDSVIDSVEEAGGQHVTHRYTVVKADGEGVKLASNPSVVRVGMTSMTVPTEVTFRWRALTDGGTEVGARIELCFDGVFDHLMATLSGTETIWRRHVIGEMEGAARLLAAKTL